MTREVGGVGGVMVGEQGERPAKVGRGGKEGRERQPKDRAIGYSGTGLERGIEYGAELGGRG